MKSRDLRIFFIFIALLFSLEVISYLYNGKSYALFYQSLSDQSTNESNYSLYSTIDPILGYTHNQSYTKSPKPYDRYLFTNLDKTRVLENGFVVYEYKPSPTALKIAVLGTSISDPYLYGGNWPWFFHLLLQKKNTPHIIYNGSVSGYNSTQLLIKLVRDVFYLENKIDAVIVCSGFSDFEDVGDTIPGHPGVHPYQVAIANSFLGIKSESEQQFGLFPNLSSILNILKNKMTFTKQKKLQLGVEIKDVVTYTTNNIRAMNSISHNNNSEFYFFFQPHLESDSQLVPEDRDSYKEDYNRGPNLYGSAIAYGKNVLENLKNEKYVFSLQDSVPKNKEIFRDFTHLNDQGSEALALHIFNSVILPISKK